MSGSDVVAKDSFTLETEEFMNTHHISFLAIMFAFYDEESDDLLKRQLAFCADEFIDLDHLVNYILSFQAYSMAKLDLNEVNGLSYRQNGDLQLYLFDQKNIQLSRKQIGPLLEVVYESYLESSQADRNSVRKRRRR